MTSIYKKVEKVRKPRVQISYEVEDGGVQVKKEIPFVVGVMGDFSGNPTKPLRPFKQRKFIQINGDNFNNVMASMTPELNFKVTNTLKNDNSEMEVQLKFSGIDDFTPGKIAEQIPALKKLLETRAQLKEVLGQADVSENLEALLEQILQNDESLQSISKDLGVDPSAGKAEEDTETENKE